MKKLLTLLILVLATLSVPAQHIIVLKTGNASQAVELQKFRRMTFAGTTVNIMQTLHAYILATIQVLKT